MEYSYQCNGTCARVITLELDEEKKQRIELDLSNQIVDERLGKEKIM